MPQRPSLSQCTIKLRPVISTGWESHQVQDGRREISEASRLAELQALAALSDQEDIDQVEGVGRVRTHRWRDPSSAQHCRDRR